MASPEKTARVGAREAEAPCRASRQNRLRGRSPSEAASASLTEFSINSNPPMPRVPKGPKGGAIKKGLKLSGSPADIACEEVHPWTYAIAPPIASNLESLGVEAPSRLRTDGQIQLLPPAASRTREGLKRPQSGSPGSGASYADAGRPAGSCREPSTADCQRRLSSGAAGSRRRDAAQSCRLEDV